MKKIEVLKKYVDILEKGNNTTYYENQFLSLVNNDIGLSNIVKEINGASTKEDRLKIIQKYEMIFNIEEQAKHVDEEDASNYIINEPTPTDYVIDEDPLILDDKFTGDHFKKTVEEEMKKHTINTSVEEEYEKVIEYSNNLAELDIAFENKQIDENQYEFYKDLTEIYQSTRPLKKIEISKLKYNYKQAGSIVIFVLAFIAISIALIIILL